MIFWVIFYSGVLFGQKIFSGAELPNKLHKNMNYKNKEYLDCNLSFYVKIHVILLVINTLLHRYRNKISNLIRPVDRTSQLLYNFVIYQFLVLSFITIVPRARLENIAVTVAPRALKAFPIVFPNKLINIEPSWKNRKEG